MESLFIYSELLEEAGKENIGIQVRLGLPVLLGLTRWPGKGGCPTVMGRKFIFFCSHAWAWVLSLKPNTLLTLLKLVGLYPLSPKLLPKPLGYRT